MVTEERKKELKEQFAQARPPMGVLAFICNETGEKFLVASRNIQTDITSITFKLNSDYHPNRHLLELWRKYGEAGFRTEVIEELKYKEGFDDPRDYADDLEALREMCLENDPTASKLWK